MRLVIISNRLSLTMSKKLDGSFEYMESAGGLATGIKSLLDSIGVSSKRFSDYLWIGWPGLTVPKKQQAAIESELLSRHRAQPVYLTAPEIDKFYSGFCNKTIWPLFHYFPVYTIYDEVLWNSFIAANKLFLKTALRVLREDDVIWVQDYHLMLLPGMIREEVPGATIGFFLHIPFPTFEVFRLLPMKWRREILQGLLGADLLGFHTYDYARYFLQCAHHILGLENDMGKLYAGERVVRADAFPISIDYDRFHTASQSPGIRDEIARYRATIGESRAILSMDRLDYSKGILNRLKSFELFLHRYPEWRGKLVLILVVVPSRIKVEHYQLMKRQIDEYVGKINGAFGSIEWTPVLYQFRSLSFAEISALYSLSDIALITPLRDGMNLIAKEYVASRADGTGVLILSELAGAARELGEAVLINPNHTEDMASALKEALDMEKGEQEKRMRAMQSRIRRYDIVTWAEDYMDSLLSLKEEQQQSMRHFVTPPVRNHITDDFNRAERRLLFLDYDGTLIPFSDNPLQALPTPEIIDLLKRLSALPFTDVTIISGRERTILSQWFKDIPLNLIAEHGAWTREKSAAWETPEHLSHEWKLRMLPLLEHATARLPGSFIENKEFSLVFHYRKSDPELSLLRVRELVADAMSYVANTTLQVVHGNKIVEIKNSGIHKGIAVARFLARGGYGFILAVGDDQTDEDMFRALPEGSYSIKVGMGNTQARYVIRDYRGVRTLLEGFARHTACAAAASE